MRAVVMQPTYLPWMGYFGMIDLADLFICYDDVQFVRRSWQQRNRIKIAEGKWIWLSVPVIHESGQKINQVRVDKTRNWRKKHWQSIFHAYSKAPFFRHVGDEVEPLYQREWELISDLNLSAILKLCELLNIKIPRILRSSNIEGLRGQRTERLLNLLEIVGANEYIANPGSSTYLEVDKFRERGIRVLWYEYQHPVYPQIRGSFMPYMSAIDVLFNTGMQAIRFVREGSQHALQLDERTG